MLVERILYSGVPMSWVVGALLLLVIVGVWRWGVGSAPNELESPDSVPTMLRFLLDRGIDGAHVLFQVRNDSRRQLCFVKYIRTHNDVGFRSHFYEQQEAGHYFVRLRQELSARGIKYTEARSKDGVGCITIDYVRDIGLAHLIVELVFERTFDVRIEKDCVAYFKNVLVSNEPSLTGVDTPGS